MALLTPFIRNTAFYFPFVGPKGLYLMAVVEAAFFLWVILAWRWKQYRPSLKNPVIAAILVFLGVSFVSAALGADFSASFWSKFERMGGVLMFLHLGAFALVASSVLEKKDWIWLFCASAAVAAIIGLDALFDQSAVSRGGGFIGNDSFLGTYLLFNAFFALYLFFSHRLSQNRWMKIFGGVMFFIISFCLVFEGTQLWKSLIGNEAYDFGGIIKDVAGGGARAAKISLAAGIAFFGMLWLAVRKNKIVRNAAIVFTSLLVLSSFLLVLSVFQKSGPGYKAMVDKFGEGTIQGRVVVWEIGWKAFLERPALGWGPENFNLAFARYYNPCLGSAVCGREIWYDRAHNIIVDTLVEVGILGLISYLAMFCAAIYSLWKAYFSKRADFAAAGIFTALFAAYFLQNLTVFDMVASYLMLFMCLGFAASLSRPKLADEKVWPLPMGLQNIAAPLVAGIVCFCFFVAGPASAGRNTIRAVSKSYGSPQKIEAYRFALEASPIGKHQIRIFLAHQWLIALQDEKIGTQVTRDQSLAIYEYLAGELEKSCRESPLDYQSYLELGRIYNGWALLSASKLPLAENILKKAIEISPNNQQAYWELTQTYLYLARIGDAEATIRKASDLYPDNIKAKAMIAEIEKIKEKVAKEKK